MGVPVAGHMPTANDLAALVEQYQFPPGLLRTLQSSVHHFPVRFWIVDNSGSMNSSGGVRLVNSNGKLSAIQATRWQELGDSVCTAGEIAQALGARTDFLLLNPTPAGQIFTIAANGMNHIATGLPIDVQQLRAVIKEGPHGGTPLTEAVDRLIAAIAPVAATLSAQGQQAAVILATDGLPNHPESFLASMQRLQQLPVWVVVRLCTDQDDVVDYWSNLDRQLEGNLEVLDDIGGEAHEIFKTSPWLTYGPPLHYAREFGVRNKIFDMLDETRLLPSQAKELMELILGTDLPEPEVDPAAFLKALTATLASVPPVYNPISKSVSSWVDVKAFRKEFKRAGAGSCAIS